MPAISIGMSVRNSAATVARSITSVVGQSFVDWELLVIDDGSTDNTAGVVRQFSDPRIRLVVCPESRGLPARLNEAVRMSSGEFFARMDGDDIMYPERLLVQYEFLKRHPEIDLVGGATMVFRDNGAPMGIRGTDRTHEEICVRPWCGFPLAHPTWMGRTAWFRENPYPEEMLRAQDQALLLRTFRDSRFATLGAIVLGYREERLTPRKTLRARCQAARAHWRHGDRLTLRLLAVSKQAITGIAEALVLACGFEYSILRQRAKPAAREQLAHWREVWAATTADRRSTIDARPDPMRSQAPAVYPARPLVSIAMPVWNSERTVGMAIASVLKQQYENWELLVIDDGSADRTVEIARSTRDPRVRVYADGEHRGLPARLNQAVSLAGGPYLARMDGDDIMYPERLATQLQFLTERPQVDLLGAAVLVFRNEGEVLGTRIGNHSHEGICSRPWRGFPLPHPTWIGPIEFFRKFAYREDVGNVEDQELLFRAHQSTRFACQSELLLGYREDGLRLRRMLAGRFQYAKMLMRASAHGNHPLAVRGILSQAARAAVDVLACGTRLDYNLLRHRARPVTAEQAERWNAVWSEVHRMATSFGPVGHAECKEDPLYCANESAPVATSSPRNS